MLFADSKLTSFDAAAVTNCYRPNNRGRLSVLVEVTSQLLHWPLFDGWLSLRQYSSVLLYPRCLTLMRGYSSEVFVTAVTALTFLLRAGAGIVTAAVTMACTWTLTALHTRKVLSWKEYDGTFVPLNAPGARARREEPPSPQKLAGH